MAASLPSIPENSAAATALVPTNGQHAIKTRQLAPWQSPAVTELAHNVGKSKPDATPLLVEGPTGTVISAIGEQRDHNIAGRAMRDAMAQQPNRGAIQHRPGDLAVKPCGGAVAAAGGGKLAVSSGRNQTRNGASFGAVYEYRDSVGKPRFVGGTSDQPEGAYAHDFASNASVRGMFEGVNEAPGRAKVVWAAVGGGPCGDREMEAARDAVVRDRAERQHIKELSGYKPYSRHSHMLA